MIVMPFSHDQPDNAARITRLGVGISITRSRYTVDRVTQELERVLLAADMAVRARELAEKIQRENGIVVAANALEQIAGG